MMAIGERVRTLRAQKGLSQSAIERRDGLHARSASLVENCYSVPGLETLDRMVSVETRYESTFSCFVQVGWRKGQDQDDYR